MWMKATEGADGTVFYIDRDSIKKEGNLLRVWELQDLKDKGPLDEKSRRVLVEYDSKAERRRVLSFSFHVEPMGAGVTVKADQTPGKWTLIVPNTTAAVVFQVATALKAPLSKTALPPPPSLEPTNTPQQSNDKEHTKTDNSHSGSEASNTEAKDQDEKK